MNSNIKTLIFLSSTALLLFLSFAQNVAIAGIAPSFSLFPASDSTELESGDTTKPVDLPYPIKDRKTTEIDQTQQNNLQLKDPKIIERTVVYDPKTGEYIIKEKIGEDDYRPPRNVSFEEYYKTRSKQRRQEYWKERYTATEVLGRKTKYHLGEYEDPKVVADYIAPLSNEISIKPRGNIELIFGGTYRRIDNPTLPLRAQRNAALDFDMNINTSVTGTIGEKLKLTVNYNTQGFSLDNQLNLEHTGNEDQILQYIGAGNVNFPLPTSLITGSSKLFGLKTKLKFGRLSVASVLSIQQSNRESIRLEGGAQTKEFEISADNYDENRHFFLGHYFRESYERNLQTLPIISSEFTITKTEVWVTNSSNITQNSRNIVGLMDLGEPVRVNAQNIVTFPNNIVTANGSNDLYSRIVTNTDSRDLDKVVNVLENDPNLRLDDVIDFSKTRARQLSTSEYTVQPQLGFISLNLSLKPDEVLAVAYEFTFRGQTYRVGEFSADLPVDPNNPNVLFLKMLKSTTTRTELPIWDLMMKNVYSLNAFQVSQEDFRLNVIYKNPGGGEQRKLPKGEGVKGVPLIKLMNLDRLNTNSDPFPDGLFDFVPGVTININNGRVYFPLLEPFGSGLRSKFENTPAQQAIADEFVFEYLYDSTKTIAQQFPSLNKFKIEGTYKSKVSSEIYIGAFNIPKGSVTINHGGSKLREGIDYTIDYNLGRVKILNEGVLQSGVPIDISYENSAFLGIQSKTLIGNRFDYWINDNFTLGATHMLLFEKPFTQKVNVGDDPIRNTILGFDFNYSTEIPGLTRLLNKLPNYQSQAKSTLSVNGEVATFRPGVARGIRDNSGESREGIIYIDDFEGSKSAYDLKFPATAWTFASTPKGATDKFGEVLFPEAELGDNLDYGKNRAKLVWYNLDPEFQRTGSFAPEGITERMQSSHYTRLIDEREIFDKESQTPNTTLFTFDLAYYPKERGPYNFENTPAGTANSKGLNPDGTLKEPETRWGGIMRDIETNDFEAANVEFLEFWVMDPFDDRTGTGELYINLGNVSEDILKDSRIFYENALPKPGIQGNVDTSNWGKISRTQPVTSAFDSDPAVLEIQDVGYDGLNDLEENLKFDAYLQTLAAYPGINPAVVTKAKEDPSNDNFKDYFSQDYIDAGASIIERYRQFDGSDGNTYASVVSTNFSSGSNLPNSEDLNRDNTLNETESYFQYRVELFDGMSVANHPFITDVVNSNITEWRDPDVPDNDVNWYHFKIPIEEFDSKVGAINDFKSIRFIRMFLTGFQDSAIMRFARLELVRNQWRRYAFSLKSPGEELPDDNPSSDIFNVSAVSVEENSKKEPIYYDLPPGVEQEQITGGLSSSGIIAQNEQSLLMEVCGLQEGDARAIYKELNFDFRRYKNFELFFHAEDFNGTAPIVTDLQNGDLEAFIRLGSDFKDNYYEYAIDLEVTNPANLTGDRNANKEVIWPAANKMDLALKEFVNVKRERNTDPQAIVTFPYEKAVGNGRITVIGNPDIGRVKTAMIGVRNKKGSGKELCGEIWINEFRLKGIENDGGSAGVLRTEIQGADLFNTTFAMSGHTAGFGQLEDKIEDRFQDNAFQYDAATNIELGKLLPEKANLRIPMYAGISRSFSKPRYDPYDYDIELNDKLEDQQGIVDENEYLKNVQKFTSIRSLNFSNVRRERSADKKKVNLWDIENFNASFAYTESYKSDPNITQDLTKKYRGGLAYNYSSKTNYIEPFKKMIPAKYRWLKPIRGFHFNLLPSKISVRNEINRQFGELILKSLTEGESPDSSHNKYFTWDRYYDFSINLTRNLKFDMSAVNNSLIDEPEGRIDTKEEKDIIRDNFYKFGRNTKYAHDANLSYTVPFRDFRALNWMTARASYGIKYDWLTAPIGLEEYGSNLNNSQNFRANSDLNFRSFYNKFKVLRKFTQKTRGRGASRFNGSLSDKPGSAEGAEDEKKKERVGPSAFAKSIVSLLTSVKRVSANYNLDKTTTLPGFDRTPQLLGLDDKFIAPGWDFAFGYQPNSQWLDDIASKGWLVENEELNNQVLQTHRQAFDLRISLEPAPSMRLDVTFKHTYSRNHSEFFRFDETTQDFGHFNALDNGSFSISYMGINTIFKNFDPETNFSQTYLDFENSRKQISQDLGTKNGNSTGLYIDPKTGLPVPGYSEGYGPYAQDVLLPAFLGAYTGTSYDNLLTQRTVLAITQGGFNILSSIPKPNWRFSYNGLARLKPFNKWFTSINITHAYNGTLSVSNYNTDFNFEDNDNDLFPDQLNSLSNNFYFLYNIPHISVSEQFAPLIGVDFGMKNSLQGKFEYKKARNVALSLVDFQVIETQTTEFTIGAGYRLKGMTLPFKVKRKTVRLENDINFKFDMSFRNDKTINFQIDQNTNTPTAGARSISISPKIDYQVNDQLSVQLFFDRRTSDPAVTSAFPTRNTKGGVSIRFSLE